MVSKQSVLVGGFLLIALGMMGQKSDSLVFTAPEPLGLEVNSKAEEVIPLSSPDGSLLYFSRAFHSQNKGGKEGGLDIWYTRKKDKEWSKAVNFSRLNTKGSNAVVGFGKAPNHLYLMNNSSNGGIAHTTVKALNKTTPIKYDRITLPTSARDIYGLFVNNQIGLAVLAVNHDSLDFGYEIHFYQKKGKGWWPMKTRGINTAHHEFSPFITNDSTLYFASNRPGGKGGFDIYSCKPLTSNLYKWSEPKNLGSGINSKKYDAYFSINDSGDVFFVSNRDSEFSDIYYSNTKGLKLEKREPSIENDSSVIDSIRIAVSMDAEKKSADILEDIEAQGQAAPEYVYFGFNSVNIEDSSSAILQLVASILKENDYVGIELQGYSDSIGSAAYNIQLSEKRSRSVRDFLITQGVPATQIRTVAYGEGTPIASNTSETGRAKNRRVRLLLLKK